MDFNNEKGVKYGKECLKCVCLSMQVSCVLKHEIPACLCHCRRSNGSRTSSCRDTWPDLPRSTRTSRDSLPVRTRSHSRPSTSLQVGQQEVRRMVRTRDRNIVLDSWDGVVNQLLRPPWNRSNNSRWHQSSRTRRKLYIIPSIYRQTSKNTLTVCSAADVINTYFNIMFILQIQIRAKNIWISWCVY